MYALGAQAQIAQQIMSWGTNALQGITAQRGQIRKYLASLAHLMINLDKPIASLAQQGRYATP